MASSGYRDYFKILGVERNATVGEIKRAFRRLARKYHPDLNPGNLEAETKFKEISEAYEVLSDQEKRQKYERFGQYWNRGNGIGATGPNGSGFDVDFGNYGNFDDFINDLLGRFGGVKGSSGFATGFPGTTGSGFPRSAARPTINLDAEVKIKISFSEAFHGTERLLSVNDERVQVKIPKGIRDGSRLRLKGKGNLQPGTGRRGDLYLNLHVETHSIWRLEGDQLKADLPVALDEIVLGGKVIVLTPDGDAELVIPSGTASGSHLRLKGKGWPLGNTRGDLIFTLIMQLPNEWSFEELDLFQKMQQLRKKDIRKSWLKSARL